MKIGSHDDILAQTLEERSAEWHLSRMRHRELVAHTLMRVISDLEVSRRRATKLKLDANHIDLTEAIEAYRAALWLLGWAVDVEQEQEQEAE